MRLYFVKMNVDYGSCTAVVSAENEQSVRKVIDAQPDEYPYRYCMGIEEIVDLGITTRYTEETVITGDSYIE